MATTYVADAFAAMGLEPAGQNGTYFDEFSFTSGVTRRGDDALTISLDGEALTLATDHWTPLAFSHTGAAEEASVAFVGYGRVAPADGEAAAIDRLFASPLTMVCAGTSSSGARFPSISAAIGAPPSPLTARCIAAIDAARILIRSISSAGTAAIATRPAARISVNSFSLRFSVSVFESFRPEGTEFGSRITAAATTGPASGPRPTSSTPQTER